LDGSPISADAALRFESPVVTAWATSVGLMSVILILAFVAR
jgi:hypothetical protein